jgi:nucleoside triphosphatase
MVKSWGKMTRQQYPEPTVGALVFNQEGKIFLMKSYKWRNKFVLPGGHVELGETLKQALKREIKEETGLDIFDIKFICFHEFIFKKDFWKKRHFLFLNFICKTNSSRVKLSDEGQEYLWVEPKKALTLPVEPYTRRTIKKYLLENKL